MHRDEYNHWLNTAGDAELASLFDSAALPGSLGRVEKAVHPTAGHSVLLAHMSSLKPGAPSTLKAAMSLAELSWKWVPFILVPPAGIQDMVFRHECFHVSQFFDDSVCRGFFISSQRIPDELVSSIAAYAVAQFEGRAIVEVAAYLQADGYIQPQAVFAGLHDALSHLGPVIADGLRLRPDFLDILVTDLVSAARRVARATDFAGYNVPNLVRRGLRRIRLGERGTWQFADLENTEFDRWIAANDGQRTGQAGHL